MVRSNPLTEETLRLITVVEDHSRALMKFRAAPSNDNSSFQDFKRFVEKIDHFYVFLDLVEGRIPEFDAPKQAPLAKHLSKIRWKITILELDTTRVYLVQISESGRKLPYGAREFLNRRLLRLEDIKSFYDRYGESHGLTPPADELLSAVDTLLRAGIESAPGMQEFSSKMAGAQLPPRSATPPAPPPRRHSQNSPSYGTGGATAPLPDDEPPQITIRETWGRYYVEKGGMIAVAQACRIAAISMDDLARRLSISRSMLTLILAGQDPMPRQTMEKLRQFMAEQAARIRPPA